MLEQLLQQQRLAYGQACVTSGFYDLRGVSRYRSQPGLHLGYDIAMPYGAPVRAAWPGTVVAHVPWTDSEWGVCVMHADGSRATYGHVWPVLPVGTRVEVGAILARIASDHLDVKIRDAQGNPYDFGAGQAWTVAAPAPAELQRDAQVRRLHGRLLGSLRRWMQESAAESAISSPDQAARRSLGLWTEKRLRPTTSQPEWMAWVDEYRRLRQKGPAASLGLETLSRHELERLRRGHQRALLQWEKQQQLYSLGLVSRRQWESSQALWRHFESAETCARLMAR
jgi:hypothetical protein